MLCLSNAQGKTHINFVAFLLSKTSHLFQDVQITEAKTSTARLKLLRDLPPRITGPPCFQGVVDLHKLWIKDLFPPSCPPGFLCLFKPDPSTAHVKSQTCGAKANLSNMRSSAKLTLSGFLRHFPSFLQNPEGSNPAVTSTPHHLTVAEGLFFDKSPRKPATKIIPEKPFKHIGQTGPTLPEVPKKSGKILENL